MCTSIHLSCFLEIFLSYTVSINGQCCNKYFNSLDIFILFMYTTFEFQDYSWNSNNVAKRTIPLVVPMLYKLVRVCCPKSIPSTTLL